MEEKIGFIGLGNMGIGMAKNLLKAGYHLQVYNRTLSKIDELGSAAVTKCQTPAAAAEGVRVLVTMLSDDKALTEVVSGPDGFLKTLAGGGLHISMSTISPDTSTALARLHEDKGSHYLAAPVFGRPEAAAAARLWIVTSGSGEAREMAAPILKHLGQGVIDFGDNASGANVVKIVGNFMIMASLEMMAEAFALAEKQGLDAAKVADFFGSTIFNSPIFQNYGKMLAIHHYEPVGFKTTLGYKDARLAFELGQDLGVPMPLGTLVHNRLLSAVAKGWGECDWAEGIGRGVTDDAGL